MFAKIGNKCELSSKSSRKMLICSKCSSYGEVYKQKSRTFLLGFCTLSGIRTLDPLIKSQLLYQLS